MRDTLTLLVQAGGAFLIWVGVLAVIVAGARIGWERVKGYGKAMAIVAGILFCVFLAVVLIICTAQYAELEAGQNEIVAKSKEADNAIAGAAGEEFRKLKGRVDRLEKENAELKKQRSTWPGPKPKPKAEPKK